MNLGSKSIPRYQGEYDGLCGLYAIVNAFQHCKYPNTELIFQTACKALPKRRWPDLLWDGTLFEDMKKMLSRCMKELKFTPDISIDYPFEKFIPQTNEEYWAEFYNIFANDSVKCGIIGLTKPSLHWIVASPDTDRRIIFADSTSGRPYVRKNRASLHAGHRRGTPNQWVINRKELITFSI